jgi:putative drug exporter of the RND superfamily
VRRLLRQEVRSPGLQAHVTGPAGVAVDLEQEAADAGKTLVYVTAGLVLLLLLIVYRAPLLALVPLVVVAVAYMAATGIAYLLIKAGEIDVSSEGTLLLLVLIFGAGTDYSLLLVHRYREELADGAGDDGEAVARALRATGPSILASGGTVIAAMLCLLLADLESTRWLGPILALGVATMLAAAFTLLPALLSLLGPRAFWPARARETPDGGVWERVAGLVRRRARVLVVAIFATLALFALGNLVGHQTLGFGQDLPGRADSTRGTAIFNRHFTPGLTSPLPVVVPTNASTRALEVLEGVPGVAYAVPAPTQAAASLLIVVLDSDPYTRPAMKAVERMRTTIAPVVPGAAVGGVPAENVDIENTNDRDTRLIIPVVLLVVFLILCVSLRALAAPAYLIATVVASFFATLGLATVIFIVVCGQAGLTYDLVLLSFIFLVALGVDYNIFLMGRAREEAAGHGTVEGMRRALVTTGSVVTGAGVILAGTFATLTLLPLLELVQIGGTVALGVVLDTFVVRALLVPSITQLAGDRAWWPGRVARR